MVDTLVLVRHGETEWSRTGAHTGRTDVPLTETGRRQADQLRVALASEPFTQAITSPLSRARETCDRAGFDDVALVRDELLEWDYGAYEGCTTAEIREEMPGWTIWTHPAPDGETAGDVGRRVDQLLREVAGWDGRVAVFAHGHLLRVLAARWCGLPVTEGRRFALDTATVSEVGWERETRVVQRWNVGCHLIAGVDRR